RGSSMIVYRHGPLIYIYLIAVILFQLGDIARGVFRSAFTVLGNDVYQSAFNVFRHAQSIAAYIYVCATLEPGPKIASVVAHAMLDIDFLVAVARPGQGQPGKMARLAHRLELFFVEKVVVAPLVAEIEPVRAGCICGEPLLQKCAKWRDAGARPDHDDRFVWVARQCEVLRLLHVDANHFSQADPTGEEGRGHAQTDALVDPIPDGVDRERDATHIHF